MIAFAAGATSPTLAAVAYAPCADFISSRIGDGPVSGTLVGWEEITITVWYGHLPGTETHYHGHYDVGDRNIVVDCENLPADRLNPRVRRPTVRIIAGALSSFTLATIAGCGAAVEDRAFPTMETHLPDLTLGPAMRELIAGTPDDVLEIANIGKVVLEGSAFLVTDFGAHRILRLDTTFTLMASFGSEGSGPGELLRPSMAVPWNGQVFVSEWTNGRFSLFDREGNFRRTIPGAAHPESFGVRRDGGIVMHSSDVDHYAIRLSAEGRSVPFAPRPPSLRIPAGTRTLGVETTLVLVGPGDTTHLLDNEHGVLLKYDGEGRLLSGRSIPEDVIRPVREYRDGVVKAFANQGRRVVGMSLLHTMSFTDGGEILIHIGRGNTAAILVDPGDYSVRRIAANMKDPAWALVSSASATVVRGSTYFAFADAGLAAHPILRDPQ